MSDQLELAAETREGVGKGASRSLRRQGRVPAVIYGDNQAPVAIHLEEKALVRALGTGHFMNSVITVAGQRTLAKDVAFHPVNDRPLHVDFLRIGANSSVAVSVPVVFVDEDQAPGLKAGGVLNVVRHELDLIAGAGDIPSEITVSLAGLGMGESLHISAVTLPGGVRSAIEDRDYTIATIAAPTTLEDGEDAPAEA